MTLRVGSELARALPEAGPMRARKRAAYTATV